MHFASLTLIRCHDARLNRPCTEAMPLRFYITLDRKKTFVVNLSGRRLRGATGGGFTLQVT
ncbi:MAG: hypothetical protein COZ70_14000 [Deltaproteobacteria bacterium CG_4_8_14_3_um_filter_51_11]|nr:MAG: hypothetical protein AUK25_08370 [Desulfobacteraceae bacterium CG2_30_51_40]PIP46021.1 MAG: hypothetical protein COX16_10320 [Deltaproteobacteria bacterium CG23_combo_of_CG06-09_8_20_14_all_51_20]PIX18460.1 MAG: hypothetical protein COZ70_14000 [Deltaproteobacteria bacterium CG_4_8_14_3_um_filter_51_11]PIY22267.1 MAG: hypothetical protein COZ11_13435 [Deltaproteobacteria bacterium CG_4_10_14_3_um_filter_51_14]PJB36066.1 MAG: hypothetical protein CO107_08845 [Deltaproteobacteria bacteriu